MNRSAKKRLLSIFRRAFARGKVTNLVTVVVALTLAMVTPALAATGGNFILGETNVATDPSGTATGITQLKANIVNPAMKLINNNTSTAATALRLQTAASNPPMTVNSETKVDNLNADKVDGLDSTELKGQTGDTGADGSNGSNGTNGATTVRTVSVSSGNVIPGTSISHVTARCATNEKATGGGYNTTTNTPADIAVFQNRPEDKLGFTLGPGWAAGFKNNDATDKAITVYAICASP
jgi:hypothetical protein